MEDNSVSKPSSNGNMDADTNASSLSDTVDDSSSVADYTSPSQLQEMTMDQDATFSNAFGTRGRTVKEFEEQLSTVRQQNFDLKLRLYLLEEKMGPNFPLEKDEIIKKNVELQMKVSSLQKEVKEKHDLLCQAVKAMDITDDEHKKYAETKEEQLSQLQKELDELRAQFQDKAPSHLANFVYDRAESLKQQIDALERETQNKDQTIDSLNRELTSANERLVDFAQQVRDYEEKLSAQHLKNGNLLAKLQEEQRAKEKLRTQLNTLSEKYALANAEMNQEREEFHREKKAMERKQMMMEMRVSMLENETRTLKDINKEQQAKVSSAMAEAQKNHNLAVSTSQGQTASPSNTDDGFISVSHSATLDGVAKAHTLPIPVTTNQRDRKAKLPTTSQVSSPDFKSLESFERLLAQGRGDDNCDIVRSVEFAQLKNDFAVQKQKFIKLKSEQLKACEIIRNMIDSRNKFQQEIAQLKRDKEQLEKELENVVSKPQRELMGVGDATVAAAAVTGQKSLPSTSKVDNDQTSQLASVEDVELMEKFIVELEAKIEVLMATLQAKNSQIENLSSSYEEILTVLEEKENKIVDLEFEVLSMQQCSKVDRSLIEKEDVDPENHVSFYKRELEEKNEEIQRLNSELKRCNCYLQEIVNTELWEKNREIEKLHKKHERPSEVAKLEKELVAKDSQLTLLKEKICELGLDIQLPSDLKEASSSEGNLEHIKGLQEQLKAAKGGKAMIETQISEAQSTIVKLRSQYEHVRSELEKSERLRHETNEASSLLSHRLEELAIFLNSLLNHKSILGFLGYAKNKKLKEIITNSLDMSRSFTMSLMVDPNQTLAQLSNITTLLNGSIFQELSVAIEDELEETEENSHLSIVPDHISLTYESHLLKKSNGNQPDNEQVIAALREQVFTLKNELQVRDTELSRLQKGNEESGLEKLSYSEWEADNKNIVTPKSTSATMKAARSDGQSESEAWSEPDRAVSRERIGLSRSIPPLSTLQHCESTEDDDVFHIDDDVFHIWTPSSRRRAFSKLRQEVVRLQKEVEGLAANNAIYQEKMQKLDRKVQESREKLKEAESEKESALRKMEELEQVVDELTAAKQQYEEAMVGKDKEMQDKINRLEAEKQKTLLESQMYAQQVIEAQNQVIVAQDRVKTVEENARKVEKELRQQCEENLIVKLKKAEEAFADKLKSVEDKCDAEIRIAQESLRLMKDEYNRDYVKKADVEKKLLETENVVTQLAELKAIVQSYEQTISSYKEKESAIQKRIEEHEEKDTILLTELAQIKGAHSKVCEQKKGLEQELKKISDRERELQTQLVSLTETTEKYNERVTSLQVQKSNLELKISELENCNADLHNRLIKAQTAGGSRFSLGLNATMPSNIAYRRQFSDQNTYSSEENVTDESRGFSTNRLTINANAQPLAAEADRAEANSSPDLGIESDHGRFSSLETNGNNPPRPLLPTIELTQSISNMFDEQTVNTAAGNEHCCQKAVEIAQENNELKRKLLRMKRALEETATQLNLANQRKKQVEKTICKQIHKTSQVLRKAKANLDSESENDAFKS